MSFSFSAGGTKEAAKESLNNQLQTTKSYGGDTTHAEIAHGALVKAIDDAPDGSQVTVLAFGHHDFGCKAPYGSFEVRFEVTTPAPAAAAGSGEAGQAE